MSAPTRYPPATQLDDGFDGGSFDPDYPKRLVLHTTETEGLPSYVRVDDDGDESSVHPHLTYDPTEHRWYQHFPLDVSARALFNESGGVETNRAGSLQIEIICYSDKGTADKDPADRVWAGHLDDQALEELGAAVRWFHEEYGVDLEWPERRAASYAEANAPGFRLTDSQWSGFDAVCSHQHVPENDHWDTGLLDIETIITYAREDFIVKPEDIEAIAQRTAELLWEDGVKVARTSFNAATIFSAVWGRVPSSNPIVNSMRWVVDKIYEATTTQTLTVPQPNSEMVHDQAMADEFAKRQGADPKDRSS